MQRKAERLVRLVGSETIFGTSSLSLQAFLLALGIGTSVCCMESILYAALDKYQDALSMA